MAPATETTKKPRRSNGPAKPKASFLLYNIVDASGQPIPGAKLDGVEILRSGDEVLDRVDTATNAGQNPPAFVRFFMPKSSRAKKDVAA